MSVVSRLFHPLCGSNPATLFRLLATNGTLAPGRIPQAAIAAAVVCLRWPFSTAERVVMYHRYRRQPAMPAPVYIVGYWRSGTTHLHNVLSRAQQFGHVSPLTAGLPWDALGLVRTLAPVLKQALPSDRYVDNVRVTPESPQEDSIALSNMLPLSYYHGLYFPQRFRHHFERGVFFDGCRPEEIQQWRDTLVYFLHKVWLQQGRKRLLMKNPVYTGQVARLHAIWPEAKFIHIYRNPYVLLPSTRHFFTRLLPELALQRYAGVDVDELILTSYPRMMNALLSDAAPLPRASFIEVRFEDFETDPLGELARIYDTLALGDFDADRSSFEAYLSQLRGYRKNRYDFKPQDIERVEDRWASFIKRWGYARPTSSEARLN
ncbi:MAG: sulfotransferase [Acidiferrobacterales bacterium]|nr:sulfotransferase [Acidiferrobacterales bacterium]